MKEPSEELKRVILDLVTKYRDSGLTQKQIEDKIIHSFLIKEFESVQTWVARVKITEAVSYLVQRGYLFENDGDDGVLRFTPERL